MDNQAALVAKCNGAQEVLYVALELSASSWRVAMTVDRASNPRIVTVPAGDQAAFERQLSRGRERFGLSASALVVSCYEAGRDGFWVHRYLEKLGVANVVVDPSSLEVSRRKRRAKTDRLDAAMLLRQLVRLCDGEKVWRVVRVPSVEEEDRRHLHRQLAVLKRDRTQVSNRITSLLATQGVRVKVGRALVGSLEQVCIWDGSPLPEQLRERLEMEVGRWQTLSEQIEELKRQRRAWLKESREPWAEKSRRLARLRGVGEESSWLLVMEAFGYRCFANRRQVGSYSGLVPTPYDSGASSREQGISKAGNARLRSILIELSWSWLRYQPDSEISHWFQQRFGAGGKRSRRIGIVAVARRLFIALWRYLEHGVLPEGALLKN